MDRARVVNRTWLVSGSILTIMTFFEDRAVTRCWSIVDTAVGPSLIAMYTAEDACFAFGHGEEWVRTLVIPIGARLLKVPVRGSEISGRVTW